MNSMSDTDRILLAKAILTKREQSIADGSMVINIYTPAPGESDEDYATRREQEMAAAHKEHPLKEITNIIISVEPTPPAPVGVDE